MKYIGCKIHTRFYKLKSPIRPLPDVNQINTNIICKNLQENENQQRKALPQKGRGTVLVINKIFNNL